MLELGWATQDGNWRVPGPGFGLLPRVECMARSATDMRWVGREATEPRPGCSQDLATPALEKVL